MFHKIFVLSSIFKKKIAGDVIHTKMSHSGSEIDYSACDGTCLF